ncbi:hypothetical protein [Clostridioides sp. ZZV15-6388]|uniref:hypothetical protein n=1 Tax=unclassified Clostridioides TaxID=2635829 RepID=UPI001D1194F8|nr:hypothetical protein [Clostridioides sp. ZZV15-6388]MCC0665131.1 hypothetical protein [Clostridioides sp. ZZV15-6597]
MTIARNVKTAKTELCTIILEGGIMKTNLETIQDVVDKDGKSLIEYWVLIL